MSFFKSATAILSAVSATLVLSAITAGKAQALSEISLPERFVIENANNRSMVVDKFGDDPNTAAKAHLYSKADTRTHTLRGVRSSNGSYEVKSAFNGNLCFTMAGGLNPNQGNGTLAIFSGDCNNSLNLRFYDDGTIRVARNTNLCLTNQGNRHSTLFNKLHWWACDNSPETKWNISAANGQSVVYNPPVVTQQYKPPVQIVTQPQQNTQPKLVFQSSGIGGLDIIDLNPLSSNFSTLNLGNNQRVKVNVSAPGTSGGMVFHTYTYFSKEQGAEMIYNLKLFKINAKAAKDLGIITGVVNAAKKLIRGGGFVSTTAAIAGWYYEYISDVTITKAEYCINKDSGFWLDANGGILMIDQKVKCDK